MKTYGLHPACLLKGIAACNRAALVPYDKASYPVKIYLIPDNRECPVSMKMSEITTRQAENNFCPYAGGRVDDSRKHFS